MVLPLLSIWGSDLRRRRKGKSTPWRYIELESEWRRIAGSTYECVYKASQNYWWFDSSAFWSFEYFFRENAEKEVNVNCNFPILFFAYILVIKFSIKILLNSTYLKSIELVIRFPSKLSSKKRSVFKSFNWIINSKILGASIFLIIKRSYGIYGTPYI